MLHYTDGSTLSNNVIDGRLVLHGPPGSTYLLLNPIQSNTWNLIGGASNAAEVHERLLAEGLHASQTQVESFIAELRRRGHIFDDADEQPLIQARQLRRFRVDAFRLSWNLEVDLPASARGFCARVGRSGLWSKPVIMTTSITAAIVTGLWAAARPAAIDRQVLLSPHWIVAFYGALIITAILHEAGHAITLSRFCDPPPRVGILGRYVVLMGPFVSTKTAWTLSQRQRVCVALGGVYMNAVVGAALAALSIVLPQGSVTSLMGASAVASWGVGAFNLLPFVARTDGHYLISDLLNTRNWRLRAVDHLVDLVSGRRWPRPMDCLVLALAACNAVLVCSMIIRGARFLTDHFLAVSWGTLIAVALAGRSVHLAGRDGLATPTATRLATGAMVALLAAGNRPVADLAAGTEAARIYLPTTLLGVALATGLALRGVRRRHRLLGAVRRRLMVGPLPLQAATVAVALILGSVGAVAGTPTAAFLAIVMGTVAFPRRVTTRHTQRRSAAAATTVLGLIIASTATDVVYAPAAQAGTAPATVAIISSGIDLTDARVGARGGADKLIGWWDFTDTRTPHPPRAGQKWDLDVTSPYDDAGSGTNAALAVLTGAAGRVRLGAARVCDATQCRGSIAQAVRWAVDTLSADIIVIPLSYAGTAPSSLAYIDEAVAYAHLHNRLVVVGLGATDPAGTATSGPHPFGSSKTALFAGVADAAGLGSRDPDLVVNQGRVRCSGCAEMHNFGPTMRDAPLAGVVAGLAAVIAPSGASPALRRSLLYRCVDDTAAAPAVEGYGQLTDLEIAGCASSIPGSTPTPLTSTYVENVAHPAHDAWTYGLDEGLATYTTIESSPATPGVIGVSAPEGVAELEHYRVHTSANAWVTVTASVQEGDPDASIELRVFSTPHEAAAPLLLIRDSVTGLGSRLVLPVRAPADSWIDVIAIGSIVTSDTHVGLSVASGSEDPATLPVICADTSCTSYIGDQRIAWTTT